MESSSNQTSVTKIYFIFFKVATLCLDDIIAHAWNSLNQLHLECFSNSFEGIPTYDEHLLAAFPSLCDSTHPKPSQFGSIAALFPHYAAVVRAHFHWLSTGFKNND